MRLNIAIISDALSKPWERRPNTRKSVTNDGLPKVFRWLKYSSRRRSFATVECGATAVRIIEPQEISNTPLI